MPTRGSDPPLHGVNLRHLGVREESEWWVLHSPLPAGGQGCLCPSLHFSLSETAPFLCYTW